MWLSFLFFNVIKWEKVHFKHPSTSRSMSQKIMIHHKLGNFILFKLCMRKHHMFNIAIRRNKRKCGATSTVAKTTSKQCIVLQWKIPICNNQIASLAQFINTCFYKKKKVPHSIFETRLLPLSKQHMPSTPREYKV
jgi:hypothetical protein